MVSWRIIDLDDWGKRRTKQAKSFSRGDLAERAFGKVLAQMLERREIAGFQYVDRIYKGADFLISTLDGWDVPIQVKYTNRKSPIWKHRKKMGYRHIPLVFYDHPSPLEEQIHRAIRIFTGITDTDKDPPDEI